MSGDEDLSLLALFRAEVEAHAAVLTDGLAGLDAGADAAAIEPLMRAAHSIKGAARVVDLDAAVRIAHAMEDALVGAQEGRLALTAADVDVLLRGLDWIAALSTQREDDLPIWMIANGDAGEAVEKQLAAIGSQPPASDTSASPAHLRSAATSPAVASASRPDDADAAVKIAAESLSRLMGLAAESLVQARRLEPLAAALQQLKARQHDVADLPVLALSEPEPLRAGRIWLAAGDGHLVLRDDLRLGISEQPRETLHRPSIDIFFDSLARRFPGRLCGVLLTGMGRDGAAGLLALRRAGHPTIAQDEGSSVVYGMPRAAAELGAAGEVLPLDQIAPR